MGILSRIAIGLTRWTEKYVPSALSIAFILTIIVFILGLIYGKSPDGLSRANLTHLIKYWGDGFWTLLEFAMQMCLIIVTGYIVAVSPLISRLLRWLAGIPKSGPTAVLTMALVSMILAFINWGLSLIASAIFVGFIARRVKGVDYRLLVASAYFGMGVVWHAGLSASAPLLVATEGHFMEQQMGLIPVSETIFSPFNLIMVLLVVVVMAVVAYLSHPRREKDIVEVRLDEAQEEAPSVKATSESRGTLVKFWDESPLLNIFFGVLGMAYLVYYFLSSGSPSLNLNILNFAFFFLGLLLHPSPLAFSQAAMAGGEKVYGVIIQFPLYAGMYGIIKSGGLAETFANAFVAISSAKTFPLIVYWYSGIVNYFVPSGGSKWAIEAPYLVEAAKTLGVPLSKTVISYAWGDMATDLIQPFWAIPLLAIARIEFGRIMGYLMLAFIVFAILTTIGFWIYGFA